MGIGEKMVSMDAGGISKDFCRWALEDMAGIGWTVIGREKLKVERAIVRSSISVY
jgi:hypothetical protein